MHKSGVLIYISPGIAIFIHDFSYLPFITYLSPYSEIYMLTPVSSASSLGIYTVPL
jgi:hypothetical protein